MAAITTNAAYTYFSYAYYFYGKLSLDFAATEGAHPVR
jgi:hypothetical protein